MILVPIEGTSGHFLPLALSHVPVFQSPGHAPAQLTQGEINITAFRLRMRNPYASSVVHPAVVSEGLGGVAARPTVTGQGSLKSADQPSPASQRPIPTRSSSRLSGD